MKKVKLAILASGSGSNAEAIIKWSIEKNIAEVVCVGSNKKEAKVIARAKDNNISTFVLLKKKNETRLDYDQRLSIELKKYDPDWIILAGYMRLLTESFLEQFSYKVINIHPSLLPLFPGTDGYGETFRAEVKEAGCTVHYVDKGMDSGRIIEQFRFKKIIGESFEDFKARGLKYENEFYPKVLERLFKD